MSEPRPAASLTANLLARRGAARPAMRRQSMSGMHSGFAHSEDLGWNDMGDSPLIDPVPVFDDAEILATEGAEAVPISASVAALRSDVAPVSPVKEQLQALAAEISARAAVRSPRGTAPASLAGAGRKAAFTLRLDPERHLRLRLLSAVSHCSAQQLLVAALDELVAQNAKVQELAAQVEEKSKNA